MRARLKQWNIQLSNLGRVAEVTAAVSELFHTTTLSDSKIASRLNSQGVAISSWQVKEARLANGWRRRNNNPEQQLQQRQDTRQVIAEAIAEGTTRNYGRNHLMTALRIHHSHRARQDDVIEELRLQDSTASERRRLGRGKRKRRSEFITLAPDHLLAIDGHDKLRRWGIEIYAGIDAYSRRIQWINVGVPKGIRYLRD